MEILLKVGSKFHATDDRFLIGARDGQVCAIEPDGFEWGRLDRSHHCVVTIPIKYETFLGATIATQLDAKKYTSFADIDGKYKWELSDAQLEGFAHRSYREHFIDFTKLLNEGLLAQGLYDAIYDRDVNPGKIYIDRSIENLFLDEQKTKRLNERKNMSVAAGTYSVGAGLDYSTFYAALLDMASPLTANLTFEGHDEQTAFTTDHVIAENLAGYTLTLKAATGHKHNGTFGNSTHQAGDGARVSLGTNNEFCFISTATDGYSGNIIIQDLVFYHAGATSYVAYHNSDGYTLTLQRNIGDGNSLVTRFALSYGSTAIMNAYNNIIFDYATPNYPALGTYGAAAADAGTFNFYHNTAIGCTRGIGISSSNGYGTYTVKNNLVQDSVQFDYLNADKFDTTAKNVSEDSTGPDAAYDDTDVHTNSVFMDYSSQDYRLDRNGNATNLAILDDGEDLSGTVDDDVQGRMRSTYYIGASEIVSIGGRAFNQTPWNLNPWNTGPWNEEAWKN